MKFCPYTVGNLGSSPGSLDHATGEKVTESEVSRVIRGTDNRQSVLGSWGPSAAREGRPKGDITSLTSEVIEGRVANGAVTWVGTARNTKLPSLGFVLNYTGFKSRLALFSPSINSKCCCRICSCCCCMSSIKVLAMLSIMAIEEGLEEELGWREIGFLPPIGPNSSLSLSWERTDMKSHDVDLMQLLLNVSTDFKYN